MEINIIIISPQKHVVGTHKKCLNLCFHGELRKMSILFDWKKDLIWSCGNIFLHLGLHYGFLLEIHTYFYFSTNAYVVGTD